MPFTIQQAELKGEFRSCPTCGYRDGFHSMFRRDGDVIRWLFICPSCHDVFDIGFTVDQARQTGERGEG